MIRKNNPRFFFILTMFLVIFSIPILYYFIDSFVDNDFNSENIKILEKRENKISYDNSSIDTELNLDEMKSFFNNELEKERESNYLSEIQDFQYNIKKSVEEETKVINDNQSIKENNANNANKEIDKEQNITVMEVDNRPKLVIIIDDVAFKYQVKRIHKLGMQITLSMFPADMNHPNTPRFAKNESVPMVHLPLQAEHFKREEINTLKPTDSYEKIKNRITNIKKHFPYLHYLNNHTGSKFTSNYKAMKNLISILKDNEITFVDSVTTHRTVSAKVCKELGVRCLKRDIFIDNKLEISYIEKQLQKAIKVAKKYGTAIAIGHPHKKTIQAIGNMKEFILKNVKLVYINGV